MIPVILVPVFPGCASQPARGADLLASNADRDTATDILCAAVADGRLTLAELDERLENVLSARTLREIARVISDLPGPRFSEDARPAVRSAASPARTVPVTARPQPPAETRWSLLQSLVPAAGLEGAGSPA